MVSTAQVFSQVRTRSHETSTTWSTAIAKTGQKPCHASKPASRSVTAASATITVTVAEGTTKGGGKGNTTTGGDSGTTTKGNNGRKK